MTMVLLVRVEIKRERNRGTIETASTLHQVWKNRLKFGSSPPKSFALIYEGHDRNYTNLLNTCYR
jgi:hypothetical protein